MPKVVFLHENDGKRCRQKLDYDLSTAISNDYFG